MLVFVFEEGTVIYVSFAVSFSAGCLGAVLDTFLFDIVQSRLRYKYPQIWPKYLSRNSRKKL